MIHDSSPDKANHAGGQGAGGFGPAHNPDSRQGSTPAENKGNWPAPILKPFPSVHLAQQGSPASNGRLSGQPAADTESKGPYSLAFDDPERLAHQAIEQRYSREDGLTLRRYREDWYKWTGKNWRVLSPEMFEAELRTFIQEQMILANIDALAQWRDNPEKDPPTARKVTENLVRTTAKALHPLCILDDDMRTPGWWNGFDLERRDYLAVNNGLLDINASLAAQKAVLLPHTPQWFSPVCLPYDFNWDAACPKWVKFIEQSLSGDKDLIAIVQEWFGYCLTPDTSQQKFLMLVGDGGNGKSVICAGLEAVLGSANCSHVALEMFSERFSLKQMLGKLVNIASEIGDVEKTDEGILKKLACGETVSVERKFKDSFDAEPTARLVIATNNMPRLKDRTDGVWRRFILIPMTFKMKDDDPNRVRGMDKPDWWLQAGELPGMLCWALAGLQRLRLQGKFTSSAVSAAAVEEHRTSNNTARDFIAQTCSEDAESDAMSQAVYSGYAAWCELNGYSKLGNAQFFKELKRSFPKAERMQKHIGSKKYWLYRGVCYSDL